MSFESSVACMGRRRLSSRAYDRIAPIPGTKRVARVEENTAADRIELSAEHIERLNKLTPAAGERHDEQNMAVIDRGDHEGRTR